MDEGGDVRVHLNGFFDAVDKLGEMDVGINPDLLAIMLLYSLPSSFENFRCAIESRDELPDPETLRVKIIEENDARKNCMRSVPENAMFSSKKSWYRQNKPNWKQSEKEISRNSSNENEKFKFRCHKCGKYGHKANECTYKKNEKNKDSNNSGKHAKNAENMSLCAHVESFVNGREHKWCLDSGATSHLSNESRDFLNKKKVSNVNLNLANNQSTKIVGAGIASFTADVFGEVKNVTLDNTLHVPDLRTNLLSVSKIADKGCEILFKKNHAIVFGADGDVKLIGDRVGDLYFVRVPRNSAFTSSNDNFSSLEIWHRRLGHVNYRDLVKAVANGSIEGVEAFDSTSRNTTCEVCCKGKMTRTSFPKSSDRKTNSLDIIHTDLCGPFRTESNGKAKYFVEFIDDQSRWCEVRFLKSKTEVVERTFEVINLMENQKGRTVKCIQSDNGTEYINNDFEKLLKKRGITRRLTVPYNPEQNGISERKNRTLLDMARCLLIESGLPSSFWAEAVNTANYLRNRCPSKSLNGKTPYEMWTGKKPNLKHLRIFGSKVFCLNRSPGKGKLTCRSKEGILVGYSEESKAYRIWVPEERKVEISRDVKFMELNEKIEENETDVLLEEEPEITGPETIDVDVHPMLQQNVSQELELERDDEIADDEGEVLREEENVVEEQQRSRRGPGRPKLVRTGAPGRPKKVYNELPQEEANNTDFVLTCEVPMKQALTGPDAGEWLSAMVEEMKSILKNDTWKLVNRSRDIQVIGSRMVLRNKYRADGTFERRKARLVAQGFSQKPGIHFSETFAPVARFSSIRLVASLAAQYGMKIKQFDVKTAYLNGELEEEIFMEAPKGLEKFLGEISESEGNSSTGLKAKRMLQEFRKGDKVCLLKKSLYGLRQAGRSWYCKLNKTLKNYGAIPTASDPCLFRIGSGEDVTLIAIYVDDILVASRDLKRISEIRRMLADQFEIKDLGDVKHCLGVEFSQVDGQVTMHQRGYVADVLERFGMSECKPVGTPVDLGTKLKTNGEQTEEDLKLPYRELVGALTYLATTTRPDISFAVSCLGQFNNCYKEEHWKAAKRVLRYLKGTMGMGLTYGSNAEPIKGFVDADWGSCPENRRSYTGFVFLLNGGPVSWDSKKQKTVALSTTEAEYMALSECVKEAIYLQRFLRELGFDKNAELVIFCDNRSCLKLAENPTFHARSKHIDIRHHFVRDALQDKKVSVAYVPTNGQVADFLTKGLARTKHEWCAKSVGLVCV
jgi:hypothetical protein